MASDDIAQDSGIATKPTVHNPNERKTSPTMQTQSTVPAEIDAP
jgi:hypothetical protein